MYSQKGRIPRKLLHTAIIICVAVLCLTSVGITSAKYISQSHGNDSASVARFSPSLISENNIDISDIKKPGNSTEKTFKVQNFSGDSVSSVSEVTIKYTISLKTTGNLPLRFTLLDADGHSLKAWECNGTNGQREYKYECPLVFSPGTLQSHTYQLKAEWPNTQNDSKFSGMTDAVYVSVKWEQVD